MNMKTRELVKMLKDNGFEKVSQCGSHAKYRNGKRIAIVPMHGGDIKIGTLKSILKQAGLE